MINSVEKAPVGQMLALSSVVYSIDVSGVELGCSALVESRDVYEELCRLSSGIKEKIDNLN